jgi:hypothetical protein
MDRTLSWLQVEIGAGPEADDVELAELSAGLRTELLELDVDAVVPGPGAPPPRGAKGLDAGAMGTLLVSLPDSAVVVALVEVLRSWLSRSQGRKVRIRAGKDVLDVTGVSAEDQAKIIASWLDSHGK